MKKFIIITIIILLLFFLVNTRENFNLRNNIINNNYICFLCVNLTNDLIKTAINMLKYGYKVFIMVDNNSIKHPKKIKNINILQIYDRKSIELGYKNASATLKKNPVTWDKVFYYFSNIDINFKNIWFIEEDVFIPRFNLLLDLDKKYKNEDLLCKQDISYNTDKLNKFNWHWNRAKGKIDKPWYRSLMCCHRQSQRLLQRIKDYVDKNGSLLFLEFMINTLAHHNNYNIKTIPNLKTITWKKKYKVDEIKMDNFYHPMKDLKEQEKYRNILNYK